MYLYVIDMLANNQFFSLQYRCCLIKVEGIMTLSTLLTLILVVTSYDSGSLQQQYTIEYTNVSNQVSCWKEGAQLPCQDVVQILKEAQIQSNITPASVTPTEVYGADDMECPTWMHYSNETNSCLCGAEYHGVVKCNTTLNETYILGCYQMTFDDKFQRVIAGLSFYGCTNQAKVYSIYYRVPANRSQINEKMCNQFYRGGRLCGACRDGYSPLVYSYQVYCKQCSDSESKYNWAIFAAVTFIPLTLFYIFVILFKFNANSPQLNAFAFLAQSVSNPANIRGILLSSSATRGSFDIFLLKLLATLYGIWNLDYFRMLYPDICLRLTTLQALSLDYVTAFYPLVLIMFTYFAIKLYLRECRVVMWMWIPIKACLLKVKKTDDIKTSLIDVFATFLILSYQKVLSVNFDLLAFTSPIDSSGKSVGKFLYYDANYEYFGPDHLPYGILAIFSFTIFNFLPFLLLLFYPMRWFQKCLNWFKLSHLTLHTFVDSFAGCYKDGTEPGTRDCRYFAALFLFLRILPYIIYQVTLDSFYGWNGIVFALFAILFAIAQPYKSKYKEYNTVTVVMIVALVMIIVGIMIVTIAMIKVYQAVNFSTAVAGILIALPQLYPVAIGVKWIYGYKHVIFGRILLKVRPLMNKSSSESSLLIESDYRTKSYSCQQVA